MLKLFPNYCSSQDPKRVQNGSKDSHLKKRGVESSFLQVRKSAEIRIAEIQYNIVADLHVCVYTHILSVSNLVSDSTCSVFVHYSSSICILIDCLCAPCLLVRTKQASGSSSVAKWNKTVMYCTSSTSRQYSKTVFVPLRPPTQHCLASADNPSRRRRKSIHTGPIDQEPI